MCRTIDEVIKELGKAIALQQHNYEVITSIYEPGLNRWHTIMKDLDTGEYIDGYEQ